MHKTSSSSKPPLWVLWILPLLLTLGLIFLTLKPKQKSWTGQGGLPSTPSKRILDIWRNTSFTQVDRNDSFAESLKSIPFAFVNSPPDTNQFIQRQEALDVARHFLYGLAYKDAKEYMSFRALVDSFKLDKSLREYRVSELRSVFPDETDIETLSASDLIQKWFQSRFIPRGTNGLVLRDQTLDQLVLGISLEESAFTVERLKSLPMPLNLFVTKGPNDGYADQKSWISFEPSPDVLLKKYGFLDYLIIKLHVRPKIDPPMPVFVSFYWDSSRNKWLPLEHAIPYAEPRRQDYAF